MGVHPGHPSLIMGWSRFAYPVQQSYRISVDEWSDQPRVPACSDLETSYWSLLLARTRTSASASVSHSAVVSERRQPVVASRFRGLWRFQLT